MHSFKNLIYITLVSILLFAHLTVAQDAQKRNSLLAKRAGNNKNIFHKTSTTTAEPVYEDEEYPEGVDIESDDQENEHHTPSTTTSTTEAPKKMIRPSVRPMRSNEDLLSALKKRRLIQKNNKSAVTQKPVQEEKHFEPEVKPIKVKTTAASVFSKRFNGPKFSNIKAPAPEIQSQNVEEQPIKSFRPPNRFARS